MSIFDVFFICLYILCGIGVFLLVGKHFGPGYGIAGFFVGYILTWLFLKRLIGYFIPAKKPPPIGSRRNKNSASAPGKVAHGQKQD